MLSIVFNVLKRISLTTYTAILGIIVSILFYQSNKNLKNKNSSLEKAIKDVETKNNDLIESFERREERRDKVKTSQDAIDAVREESMDKKEYDLSKPFNLRDI